jgi:hypothetical protein
MIRKYLEVLKLGCLLVWVGDCLFGKAMLGEMLNLQKVKMPKISIRAFWSFYVQADFLEFGYFSKYQMLDWTLFRSVKLLQLKTEPTDCCIVFLRHS